MTKSSKLHMTRLHMSRVNITLLQPIAFGVSFNLNLQSHSPWSLFIGTWQKRPRELDYRLRLEIEGMTLQMQYAVNYICTPLINLNHIIIPPINLNHVHIHLINSNTLIKRNPPPGGGVLLGWFPNAELGGRGPPMKNNTNF